MTSQSCPRTLDVGHWTLTWDKSGDFIFCPMLLCIALVKQKTCQCPRVAETVAWVDVQCMFTHVSGGDCRQPPVLCTQRNLIFHKLPLCSVNCVACASVHLVITVLWRCIWLLYWHQKKMSDWITNVSKQPAKLIKWSLLQLMVNSGIWPNKWIMGTTGPLSCDVSETQLVITYHTLLEHWVHCNDEADY